MWNNWWSENNLFDAGIWLQLFSLGIILVLTGLLIVLVPEILIAFIASIFFLLGGVLIYWAFRLRRERKKSIKIKIDYID